ncbi:MAG TPA: malto-oligosyltrehalose synthase, partial [Candidatus Binatia bacterium]|nr:malto-oligosyltrehalose synthase [Candidatus Binatia bacterium]
VSDLVGVRVEDPAVFDATHAHVLEWTAGHRLDGLRVDHVDGLWDPRAYLERLRTRAAAAAGGDVPIWVEKILIGDEHLRDDWPVAGTTGYEFASRLEAAFVDPAGFTAIERWYRELIRAPAAAGFPSAARAGKRRLLDTWLSPDARRLARHLRRLVRRDPRAAGLDPRRLMTAVLEVLVAFPIYRTYVDEGPVTAADGEAIADAIAGARGVAGVAPVALDLLAEVLLHAGAHGAQRDGLAFVRRFQQTSAPVMAKGVEDTALYRWLPLASRNDVGSDPGAPLDGAVAALHAANAERAARWPHSLLAVTTHDTKRSGDLRARLDILAEMPARWTSRVAAWRRMHRPHRRRVRGRLAPDANTEYLVYQTLVGIWPLATGEQALAEVTERVRDHLRKATREAKVHTSWLDPEPQFEQAVDDFVVAILGAESPFVAELDAFARDEVVRPGLWTALARTLVHLTAPGVPDVYQGDELWSFTLTDPDNRRPVDFASRRALLAELELRPIDAALVRALVDRPEDGAAKLHVVRTALGLRRREPDLFAGGYEALVAEGERAAHVLAFARSQGERTAITVVPRLVLGLGGRSAPVGSAVWGDTALRLPGALARRRFTNVLTGEPWGGDPLPLASALGAFPAALLLG